MLFLLNYDDNPASQENVFMIQSMSCSEGLATGFRTGDVNSKDHCAQRGQLCTASLEQRPKEQVTGCELERKKELAESFSFKSSLTTQPILHN